MYYPFCIGLPLFVYSSALLLDAGDWLNVLHTFETSPCPLNCSLKTNRIVNWKNELFLFVSLNWHAIKSVLFGENFMDIIGNFYYWKSREIIPLYR